MNILFYVEPLIEMGRPYFKKGWVTNFCENLIKTIEESPYYEIGNYHFTIVLNEPLSESLDKLEYVGKIVLLQKELTRNGQYNYLELTKSWHLHEFSEEQFQYYINLMQEKLKNCPVPDIIITFSPVPFLQELFKEALILHHEYSVFSRNPYPETWYFDISGMNGGAYPTKYWNEISLSLDFTKENQSMLEKLKQEVQSLVLEKSPFRRLMLPYRRKFDYLILLPLQFSEYYLFDALTKYRSQYEYLVDVLEKVPCNVGVVVTTHPDYNILSTETIDFFKKAYPNFIYQREFEQYYAPSQYLLADVDAVITVSSSVGIQAALWDKKLISLGKDYFSFMADSDTLNDIIDVLNKDSVNKNAALFWLLTRYSIPEKYLRNSRWLHNFLCNSLKKHRSNYNLSSFYELIDNEKSIFEGYTKEFLNARQRKDIPLLSSNYSYDFIKELYPERIHELTSPRTTEVYIDLGTGFNENNCIRQYVTDGINRIDVDLKSFKGIKGIRIDPLNCPGIVEIIEINCTHGEDKKSLTINNTNAVYIKENEYYFLTNDPQLYLNVDNMETISFSFKCRHIGMLSEDDILEILRAKNHTLDIVGKQLEELKNTFEVTRQREAQLQKENEVIIIKVEEKESIINKQKIILEEKESIINEQKTSLEERDNVLNQQKVELEAILSSSSWRITKPLRYFIGLLKKGIKI